jgi:hypothetical protein
MIAAYNFIRQIESQLEHVSRIQVDLYGSLSLDSIGHHTDRAMIFVDNSDYIGAQSGLESITK